MREGQATQKQSKTDRECSDMSQQLREGMGRGGVCVCVWHTSFYILETFHDQEKNDRLICGTHLVVVTPKHMPVFACSIARTVKGTGKGKRKREAKQNSKVNKSLPPGAVVHAHRGHQLASNRGFG